ncbi:Iojap protein [Leifsonia rubra CMS 76R]|uniref:Ribosomal silencing factor RsfS n=1 Tax=Rhodoglobus vestalii TaxID=193384 RepID=A0A8H2PUY4_9MICO|nr:ribosome silencing factor [Rhodoglobus vestalii]EPR76979.1 Iojap protein [Leifsonia rubra CMS 76R]TQO21051.1 ribosome-associated protein [Rhodoglobus vestalii]
MTASPRSLELLSVVATAADAKQATDMVALDVTGPTPYTDVFFLATGRNERNVQSIASEIEEKMIEAGVKPMRREGRAEGRWILLDFGYIVAHIFHEEDRLYYSLDRLWSDCPVIPVTIAEKAEPEADSV